MVTLNPNSPVAPDLAREIAEDRLAMAELAADASALSIDTLDLENIRVLGQSSTADALGWGRALAGALTTASCTRTIEGASTLTLTFDDPLVDLVDQNGRPLRWRALTNNSVFDLRGDQRLDSIAVDLDTLTFRLVKVEKQQDSLVLTFEEEAVALLRQHTSHLAVSRNSMTRAEFIWRKLIREVTEIDVPFYSPEFKETQARDEPSQWSPTKRDATRQSGFSSGAKITIQGAKADADQLNNLTIAMQVADVHQASDRARLAMICAGIGESGFRAIPNNDPNNTHEGVFQADRNVIPRKDTAQQAKYFLLGGKGFGAGGAIQAARDNPGWSSGAIAYKVEGSRANFSSDAAAEQHYQQYHAEAQAILKAWQGDGTGDGTRTSVLSYQFTRGLAGKTETSWDAMQRLASEVNWRCFCVAGVIVFISEEWLFESRSRATITEDTPGVDTIDFDWDLGKTIAEVTVQCHASRWSFPPGSVIDIENTGPASGRWLVHTIERGNLFDSATTVTLTKPIPRKPEPAATLVTTSTGSSRSSTPRSPGTSGWGKLISGNAVFAGYDQGIDFTGRGTVYVQDDCTITRCETSGSGWPGEGAIVVYRLDAGPARGRFVYTAEDFQPASGLRAGATLKAGDPLGIATGSGKAPGIETGFAKNRHGEAYGSPTDGKGSNPPNPEALAFGHYVKTGTTQ